MSSEIELDNTNTKLRYQTSATSQILINEASRLLKETIRKHDADRDVLKNNFIPPCVLSRESHAEQLCVSILKSKYTPINYFFHGPSGSGKTVLVRYAFDLFNETRKTNETLQGIDIRLSYYDCNIYTRNVDIYADILNRVFNIRKVIGYDAPPKGWGTTQYLHYIENCCAKIDSLVICLDESDQLASTCQVKDRTKLLQKLLEIPNISLILVSNPTEWVYNLDNQVSSRLQLNFVKLTQYSVEDLEKIVLQRCQLALRDGAYDAKVISEIARMAHIHNSDARNLIDLLRNMVILAEDFGRDKLDVNDIDEALRKTSEEAKMDEIRDYCPSEKLLLKCICNVANQEEKGVFTASQRRAINMYYLEAPLYDPTLCEVPESCLKRHVNKFRQQEMLDKKRVGIGKTKGTDVKLELFYPPEHLSKSIETIGINQTSKLQKIF